MNLMSSRTGELVLLQLLDNVRSKLSDDKSKRRSLIDGLFNSNASVGYSRSKLNSKFDSAYRSGYISKKNDESYEITKKGLRKLAKLKLQAITKPDVWDGKWRIMMFDIPEDNRPLRDAVRRQIKLLGMIQLQKSVWAHKYECLQQFRSLVDAYGGKGDIVYVRAEEIEGFNTSQISRS